MIPTWLPDTLTTDIDRMVSRALLWGIEALELRMVGGPMQRVPDVNESRLRRKLEESELPVAAIVPGIFEGHVADRPSWLDDLERSEESFRFCRRIGCPVVVVSAFSASAPEDSSTRIDVLRRAGDRAGRAGVVLAVLNEPGAACSTGRDLADLLGAVDHPAVKAAYDPSNDEPDAVMPDGLLQRLALLRADLAIGGLPPSGVLSAAAAAGFTGPVSLVLRAGTPGKDGLSISSAFIASLRNAGQKLTPK